MADSGSNGRFTRAAPLTLTVSESGSTLVLRIAGELDLSTVGQVIAALDGVDIERTTGLVFDLRDLAFLDLAGLTTITRANEHYTNHAIAVTVVKPRGLASRVLTLTGAHRELDIVDHAEVPTGRFEPPQHPMTT
jgi:anti-sigma B factor antagonist